MNRGLTALALVACILFGWYLNSSFHSIESVHSISQVRENSPEYQFINPLLYIDNSSVVYTELDPLKHDLERYVEREIFHKRAEKVAVYYRELNSGVWVGVNPDEKFVPASILKVANLITYLRLAEDEPDIMERRVYYEKNPNDRQNYPPTKVLESGYYPVRELLGQSIIESDNAAARALSTPIEKEIGKLFISLNLPMFPYDASDFMSPREVSRIFRTLYSSTYLLNSYSEQALKLLTQTKFSKGITQGIGDKVKVAHKFGERVNGTNDRIDSIELHDCGIVYVPENPYLLCIMTRGKDLLSLESAIASISKLVYENLPN